MLAMCAWEEAQAQSHPDIWYGDFRQAACFHSPYWGIQRAQGRPDAPSWRGPWNLAFWSPHWLATPISNSIIVINIYRDVS